MEKNLSEDTNTKVDSIMRKVMARTHAHSPIIFNYKYSVMHVRQSVGVQVCSSINGPMQ